MKVLNCVSLSNAFESVFATVCKLKFYLPLSMEVC